MNFKEILNSKTGKIVISIVLGFGIACLFHKACKDKECIRFSGPVITNINDKIFQHDGKCYTYKAKAVKCNNTKKIIDFGVESAEQNHLNFPSTTSLSTNTFIPSFFTPVKTI